MCRGPFADKSWHVHKRYNDFRALHASLLCAGIELPLPPKRLIGNREPDFISQRLHGLQKYLNAVLMNPILASSLPTKLFIDPINYCQPFSGKLQLLTCLLPSVHVGCLCEYD